MIKVILFAVIGLLIGLGGGSAASVMQARKAYAADVARRAKVVADSIAKADEQGAKRVAAATHRDSTPTDAAAGDSSHAQGARTASADAHAPAATDRAHVSPSTVEGSTAGDASPTPRTPKTYNRAVQTVEANGVPRDKPLTAVRPPLPPKPIATASVPPGAAKLAKIFAAMPAKDAAKVLEQLDDAEVQGVIATLSEKQAAAILQSFPTERAATISKALLRSVPPVKP